MAVRTGYKTGQITALRARIAGHRAALKATLPNGRMGDLALVCGCSDCIDAAAYTALATTPIPALSRLQIAQYFGGAGVLEADTSAPARLEAHAIYLHVLDALAEAVLAAQEVEGSYRRAWDFVEPSYWLEPLYSSGFLDDLAPRHRAMITDLLVDLVELGIARTHPRLTDVLIYLSRGTDALAQVLRGVAAGPPRRRLAFWVAVAGWSPNSPAGMKNHGISDFSRDFDFMDRAQCHLMEDALADPGLETLLYRYVLAARDAEWQGYLFRLIHWRDNTVERNASNRLHPRPSRLASGR